MRVQILDNYGNTVKVLNPNDPLPQIGDDLLIDEIPMRVESRMFDYVPKPPELDIKAYYLNKDYRPKSESNEG